MVSEVLERPERLKPEKINRNLDVEEPRVAQSTVYTSISTILANKLGTIRVDNSSYKRKIYTCTSKVQLPLMDLLPHVQFTCDVNVRSFENILPNNFSLQPDYSDVVGLKFEDLRTVILYCVVVYFLDRYFGIVRQM